MNKVVGYITREMLAASLPDRIEIRKSSRDGARYPLYLSGPFGPWHMNTRPAQEVLLCSGVIHGANGCPDPEPERVKPEPEAVPVPVPEPEPEPVNPEPEAVKPEPEPLKGKPGFFDDLNPF